MICLEMEGSDLGVKVLEVKQAIEQKYSHAVDTQRLIFAGKILEDERTVESYNISEKEFLVLMVRTVVRLSLCSGHTKLIFVD